MDLEFSATERAFRDELGVWLRDVKQPPGLRDYGATPTPSDIEAAKRWQGILYRDGWAGLSWPQEFGGREASVIEQAIFAEEMARAGYPRELNLVGLQLAGPMIIAFGTDVQQQRFLEPILEGEEVWCQLFSEPNAGSDLASLSTSARATADRWCVSGQKVWSSGAQYADYGLLLARTDPEAQRHRGISCFLLPMDRKGITVRPIRQMDGEAKFNEVFLDDVEVTSEEILGELGQGWPVAMSTLGRERLTLGSQAVGFLARLDELVDLVQESPSYKQRWTDLWSRTWLLRANWLRFLSEDREAGPRMSILKLQSSEIRRDLTRLAVDLVGRKAISGDESESARAEFLAAPGQTIAGGTSEVQRNILGERVLGLPREPKG